MRKFPEINADLIIRGDYGENDSIPVKIVVREQYEEDGQNMVVLGLFIDTSALDNSEIEKVNSLLNLQTSNMLDASDFINKMSGETGHSMAVEIPLNQHNIYDYEGHVITNNESAHEIDEFPVISWEKTAVDRKPSHFSNFSQIFPIDSDSGDSEVTNRVDNIGAEKISASISKPEIEESFSAKNIDSDPGDSEVTNRVDNIGSEKISTSISKPEIEESFSAKNGVSLIPDSIKKEFDISKAYLHKEHHDIQSGENYINSQGDVRVSVQKFVIKAAVNDSEGTGFVLHASSDNAPLVLKPQNTAFKDSPLLKLLQKYSSSGEKIEIAVVVSHHSSVMSGSEANSGTDATGSNHVPLVSSEVEKVMVDKIMNLGSDVEISRKMMSNQDLAKQLNVKMIKSPGINEGLNITHEYSETENPKLFYSGGELDGRPVEAEIVQGYIDKSHENIEHLRINNRHGVTPESKTAVSSETEIPGTSEIKSVTGDSKIINNLDQKNRLNVQQPQVSELHSVTSETATAITRSKIIQGSTNEPDKHVQNPQIPNRFPITSETKTDVNSIKTDYAVPEDGNIYSGIVGDRGGSRGFFNLYIIS